MAAEQSVRLSREVTAWQHDRVDALNAYLAARSPAGRVRRGVAHRIIAAVPGAPVLDVSTVVATYGVRHNAARAALETLADAGLLLRDRRADRTKTLTSRPTCWT